MAGTGRHATPDAGEDDFKTRTRQVSREMHIPEAWHQANQQDPWGALCLRRQECCHRKIKGDFFELSKSERSKQTIERSGKDRLFLRKRGHRVHQFRTRNCRQLRCV